MHSDDNEPAYLTEEQTARYLSVSIDTLRAWRYRATATAQIPHVKLGRCIRYSRAALDAYLAANTRGAR